MSTFYVKFTTKSFATSAAAKDKSNIKRQMSTATVRIVRVTVTVVGYTVSPSSRRSFVPSQSHRFWLSIAC